MDQKGKITVEKILKKGRKIEILFSITNSLKHFFRNTNSFWYALDENVEIIPDGIAAIPFICNILPIAWLTDSLIEVPELDKAFYDSIPDFMKGYEKMYPMLKFWSDNLEVQRIVHYSPLCKENKSAAFFSGGVDAYATLIAHIDEKPVLLTINGSDVSLDDTEGWNNVSNAVDKCCEEFGLKRQFIHSNFRCILDEGTLSSFIEKSGDGWWHGFQHGIGLIGHAAPLAYLLGLEKIYIGSTYTPDLIGKYTCASDPTIDNYVKYIETTIVHDQYDCSRQVKIKHICEYYNKTHHNIPLHVCWQSKGGKNCCKCEKCYRTILGIFAEGYDPRLFSFNIKDSGIFLKIKKDIEGPVTILRLNILFWKDIQNRIRQNYKKKDLPADLRWIFNYNFDKVNQNKYKVSFVYKYPWATYLYHKYKSLLRRVGLLHDEYSK